MGITISPWMMAFLMLMTGFAGFVDSAAGGGGLISLPAYLFAGLPPHYTYATNKFSAACGTTFATASFFKSGAMNVKVGVLAAIGSFAGSALGAHIVLLLSDEMLRTMMFIILPVAAVIILWQRNLPDENRDDGIVGDQAHLVLPKALLQPQRKGGLAAARAARDANDQVVHDANSFCTKSAGFCGKTGRNGL